MAAPAANDLADPFVFRLSIFVLAVFVGYYVVWSVTPALHTPLMSVTNAISSVIVVGALLAVGVALVGDHPGPIWARALGFVALTFASVNIFGGFLVTKRMLACSSASRSEREPRSCMSADLAALFYLVAGALFIMALRGLSNPETSRRGNLFGMIGMAIAIVTTLAAHPPASVIAWVLVVVGMAIGGGIGAVIARRVPMTSMPELVAAFHSLVGMAAVLVAAGALYAPAAFGIGSEGAIHRQSLIEMSLGVAIGAITFTGSVIAFLKLSGRMSGAPIMLPARHAINIALALALVALDRLVLRGAAARRLLADRRGVVPARRLDHHPDRRRRHAGRDLDAQFLFRLGGGRHRFHARQFGADHHRRAGRLLGRDPVLHHVQGHEPLVHLGDPRRLRRRSGGPCRRRRRPAGQDRLGGGRRLHPQERRQGHHRAGLRHGGGAGAACAARDGATSSRPKASRSNTPFIRWPAACRAT